MVCVATQKIRGAINTPDSEQILVRPDQFYRMFFRYGHQ
jgi:hypothetical protein